MQTLGTVPDSGSSGSTGGGTTSGDGTTSTGTPSLITGEKDATYANEILNFTVPASGLFLYREASSTASPAASIAAGNAVKLACEDLKKKILELAQIKLGAYKRDLEFKDGYVVHKIYTDRKVPLSEFALGLAFPDGSGVGGPAIGVGTCLLYTSRCV